MSTRHRISQCVQVTKEAGLQGKDMNEVLSKLAEQHDLNGNEIRRIAEEANRIVQLELYKVAGDKRFTFKLADGMKIAAARKTAEVKLEKEDSLLAAVKAAGRDPFEAPVRYGAFSDNPAVPEVVDSHDRAKIAELDRAYQDLTSILKQAQADEIATIGQAHQSHEQALEAAQGLIQSGVTLPSLFESILAAVSGDKDRAAAIKYADALIELIIEGLKAKGVKNFQMGFRHRGRPDLLEGLSTADLIALCHRASAYCAGEPDIRVCETKSAERLMEYIAEQPSPGTPDGPGDGEQWLNSRGSQNGIYKVPQAYLGDVADNMPGGKPRVFNANSQFVIAVDNLVGDQMRMRKNHDAQEYLGLKLKQIENAIRDLQAIRQAEKDKQARANEKLVPDQNKTAVAPLVAPLVAAAGRAVGQAALPAVGKAVGQAALPAAKRTGMDMLNAAGNVSMIGSTAASALPRRHEHPSGPTQTSKI